MAFFGLVKRDVKPFREVPKIRGPKLRVLVEGARGIGFLDTLKLIDIHRRTLASNKRLDAVVVGDKIQESVDKYPCGTYTHTWNLPGAEYAELKSGFPAWSGTMGGCKKGGKKLGSEIVYKDPKSAQRYVFPVPEAFRKERNAMVLVEHPNYETARDGKDLVVAVWREADVELIKHFPPVNGRCFLDKVHGIPQERKGGFSYQDPIKTRLIWREDVHVGPLVRMGGSSNHIISFTDSWSRACGVIVEEAE